MINDYASLQSSIANWLARADLESAIPGFIALAEARINRALYVRERLREESGTSANGVIPVPADLDRVLALQVSRGAAWVPLSPVPANDLRRDDGIAVGYSVVGDEIRLTGGQDARYSLAYYARIPALSDTNSTNWLLAKEPGLYLYGALIEATPYIRDDERTMIWGTQFQMILDDCMTRDDYARFGNAPAMRGPDNAP